MCNLLIGTRHACRACTNAITPSLQQCPPCRGFTPKLAEFYEKMKGNFEIIFVSGDSSESQFEEYLGEMPWVAVPYNEEDTRDKLNEIFEVQGKLDFMP